MLKFEDLTRKVKNPPHVCESGHNLANRNSLPEGEWWCDCWEGACSCITCTICVCVFAGALKSKEKLIGQGCSLLMGLSLVTFKRVKN